MRTQAAVHPHAPELGWTKRLLGSVYFTGVFWLRLAYWGMGWVPRPAVGLVVACFVAGFFLALGRVRVAIASNLEAVLGGCGFWERQRRVFRTLYIFAWCQAERYEYLHHARGFAMSVEGNEHLAEAARSGKGLIFVTAHVGHWETASHLISSSLEREVHVVREEEIDPRTQDFLAGILRSAGEVRYTTHFAADDPSLGLTLAGALFQGDVVALQGDRPRGGGRTVPAMLFGRPMPLPAGPAALARAAEVPLVPIFSFREGRRRYRVCLRAPIQVAAGGDRNPALAEATMRLAAEIEWAIRREPCQWFCFQRLWS